VFVAIASVLVKRLDVDPLQRRQGLVGVFFAGLALPNTFGLNSVCVG